jgi:hypothetical protein
MSDKSHTHGSGESYSGVIPTKQPNKSGGPPAEAVEGRPLAKENAEQPNPYWTPSQAGGPNGLDRAREAAKKDGKLRVERPAYDLTIFKLHCGKLTLKIYGSEAVAL